jgi:hypothetical protein
MPDTATHTAPSRATAILPPGQLPGATGDLRPARRLPSGDLALGLAGAAVALLLALAAGLPKLAQGGADNDSLMRLVTVRDLLAGQGWFDPTQYRMGVDGGLDMHWSRLVDAPIALLIALTGETAAAFLWPTLLLAMALALVVRMATALGGDEARFPALVLAVAALHFTGIFSPGSFDHHNLQLVLMLAMAAGLLAASPRGGLAAGAAAALSLGVGVETLPIVAAAGTGAALALLWRGAPERGPAIGFGLGFAGVGAVLVPATLPAGAWLRASCDAWSGGHAAIVVVAGLGLAMAAAATATRTATARLAALGAVAVLSAGAALVLLPACLGDPYAGLDPRLRQYWLDWVIEAQPIGTFLLADPGRAALNYATPLVALAVLAFGAAPQATPRSRALAALLLAVATLVSWWQLRGAVFSLALAVPVLAAWVAEARKHAARGTGGSLRLAAAWLLSFNVAWGLAAQGVATATGPADVAAAEGAAQETSACLAQPDYAALAALPATTVLAVSNLGAPILAWTPHRALAGPYHRNVAGNLAVLDMLMGSPDEASALAARLGVGIVALCPGNDETRVLAASAPGGLLAGLLAGNVPGWLEPLPSDPAMPLFRANGAMTP